MTSHELGKKLLGLPDVMLRITDLGPGKLTVHSIGYAEKDEDDPEQVIINLVRKPDDSDIKDYHSRNEWDCN